MTERVEVHGGPHDGAHLGGLQASLVIDHRPVYFCSTIGAPGQWHHYELVDQSNPPQYEHRGECASIDHPNGYPHVVDFDEEPPVS